MDRAEALREAFRAPADEFSPIPFWFWNDELTEEEILRHINYEQGRGIPFTDEEKEKLRYE